MFKALKRQIRDRQVRSAAKRMSNQALFVATEGLGDGLKSLRVKLDTIKTYMNEKA